MTCKGCTHYSVCKFYEDNITDCNQFKNKVDFLNVVRCKDCKHCETIVDFIGTKFFCCKNSANNAQVNADDYCSYGQRKDDE